MTKYTATRQTVLYGGSTYVCLDKAWGFKPGDMVRIEVEAVEDDDRAGHKEGH